jgi:hypothetical protein
MGLAAHPGLMDTKWSTALPATDSLPIVAVARAIAFSAAAADFPRCRKSTQHYYLDRSGTVCKKLSAS